MNAFSKAIRLLTFDLVVFLIFLFLCEMHSRQTMQEHHEPSEPSEPVSFLQESIQLASEL